MSTTENVHETALAIGFRLIEILLHGESTFVEFPVLASVCPICQGTMSASVLNVRVSALLLVSTWKQSKQIWTFWKHTKPIGRARSI
jgi:hypothetical protein